MDDYYARCSIRMEYLNLKQGPYNNNKKYKIIMIRDFVR